MKEIILKNCHMDICNFRIMGDVVRLPYDIFARRVIEFEEEHSMRISIEIIKNYKGVYNCYIHTTKGMFTPIGTFRPEDGVYYSQLIHSF